MNGLCDVSPEGRKPDTKCPKCGHMMGNHREGDVCWICAFNVGGLKSA